MRCFYVRCSCVVDLLSPFLQNDEISPFLLPFLHSLAPSYLKYIAFIHYNTTTTRTTYGRRRRALFYFYYSIRSPKNIITANFRQETVQRIQQNFRVVASSTKFIDQHNQITVLTKQLVEQLKLKPIKSVLPKLTTVLIPVEKKSG